jgi:hypothetical protein
MSSSPPFIALFIDSRSVGLLQGGSPDELARLQPGPARRLDDRFRLPVVPAGLEPDPALIRYRFSPSPRAPASSHMKGSSIFIKSRRVLFFVNTFIKWRLAPQ